MDDIGLEVSGGVCTVRLNIQPVNALSIARYRQIGEIFLEAGDRRDVSCIVLESGCVKAFCAGMDLKEFRAASASDDAERAAIVRAAFASVRRCPVPVIAAVGGPAVGAGVVLASVCDIRIASERAIFQMTEVDVGRCGGGAHLGRHIPPGWVRMMYFTCEPINAWQAHAIGFVQQVVPHARLEKCAWELASLIAAKSQVGLRMAKQALNQVETMAVEEGYELEQSYSTALMQLQSNEVNGANQNMGSSGAPEMSATGT